MKYRYEYFINKNYIKLYHEKTITFLIFFLRHMLFLIVDMSMLLSWFHYTMRSYALANIFCQ